jgi:hypothetical protein
MLGFFFLFDHDLGFTYYANSGTGSFISEAGTP